MPHSNISWDTCTSASALVIVDQRLTEPHCRIAEYEADNSMSIQNLAIVFGPTLFGQMVPGNGSLAGHGNGVMADAPFQNKVIYQAYSI